MKKTVFKIFLIILFLNFAEIRSQDLHPAKPEKNVPAIVLKNFSTKFPSGDPVWFSSFHGRYNQQHVYEGRFIFDNRYSTAAYDIKGNLVAFAATIEESEIPKSVITYMKENYPTYPIADALIVSRGEEKTYEIGIYIDQQYVIQVFSADGVFLRSTRA